MFFYKRAEGEGILRKNEILEVKTVDPFNASFSRQPGEYFFIPVQRYL